MIELKPSNTDNPKDAIGQTKLPMDLVPESAVAAMATAFLEGASKYGRYNWRAKGVRASIYYSAMRRHQSKWWNGEDEDADTTVEHLASIMACCAIMIDAKICGKLNDDRPPKAPVSAYIDSLKDKVKHLAEMFKDCNPHQYTIADSEEEPVEPPAGRPIEGPMPKFIIKDAEPCPSFVELREKYIDAQIAAYAKARDNNRDEALGIHPRAINGGSEG